MIHKTVMYIITAACDSYSDRHMADDIDRARSHVGGIIGEAITVDYDWVNAARTFIKAGWEPFGTAPMLMIFKRTPATKVKIVEEAFAKCIC